MNEKRRPQGRDNGPRRADRFAERTVVEEVEDPVMEISLAEAKMKDANFELGDIVQIPIESKSF